MPSPQLAGLPLVASGLAIVASGLGTPLHQGISHVGPGQELDWTGLTAHWLMTESLSLDLSLTHYTVL